MVIHIYGITLNTAKSVDQYYSSYSYQSLSEFILAISCIMTCIMIVGHTNRLDNFSQFSCTVPSCRLVGWLNRFIYRANIARAPKLATLTG